MVHDRELLDRLSAYTPIRFDDVAFRATRLGLDPLTPSLADGRWAPRDTTPVLYASFERQGALAEISYHLGQLDPLPSKPVTVHELRATTHKTLRLLLLKAVRREGAASVRQLAERLGRDYKNVHEDVERLTAAGLLEREDGRVMAPYETILAEMSLES